MAHAFNPSSPNSQEAEAGGSTGLLQNEFQDRTELYSESPFQNKPTNKTGGRSMPDVVVQGYDTSTWEGRGDLYQF